MRRNHLDHTVLINSGDHLKASRWCIKQLGARWCPFNNKQGRWTLFWCGREQAGKYRFCFANEQDKLMFMLRWS